MEFNEIIAKHKVAGITSEELKEHKKQVDQQRREMVEELKHNRESSFKDHQRFIKELQEQKLKGLQT